MARLDLVTFPDPRLKFVSEPVEKIDEATRQTLEDMLETMYACGGIGLAAVQVGILKRMLVMDIEQTEDVTPGKPIKMINPEIIEHSESSSPYNEGCLSFPGQVAEVKRPEAVTIRYLDEQGKEQTLKAEGLLATCVQHEIDHLNGVTFVDHLSRMKRDMVLRKLKRQQREEAPAS